MSIPREQWGRDHKSTMLYAEAVCVDRRGVPDFSKMRCDPHRHPMFDRFPRELRGGKTYPTRLADGTELFDHDDWDCIDDLEAAGMLQVLGTGINPEWLLTDSGWAYAATLRREFAEAHRPPARPAQREEGR